MQPTGAEKTSNPAHPPQTGQRERAILYQGGARVIDENITRPEALVPARLHRRGPHRLGLLTA